MTPAGSFFGCCGNFVSWRICDGSGIFVCWGTLGWIDWGRASGSSALSVGAGGIGWGAGKIGSTGFGVDVCSGGVNPGSRAGSSDSQTMDAWGVRPTETAGETEAGGRSAIPVNAPDAITRCK